MAGQGQECAQLLLQLSAVRSAIDRAANLVLREHLDQCLRRAIESGDRSAALSELESILKYVVS